MALTRAMLRGMGLTDEQISAIIDEHTNVTSALKDQIADIRAHYAKVKETQKYKREAELPLDETVVTSNYMAAGAGPVAL